VLLPFPPFPRDAPCVYDTDIGKTFCTTWVSTKLHVLQTRARNGIARKTRKDEIVADATLTGSTLQQFILGTRELRHRSRVETANNPQKRRGPSTTYAHFVSRKTLAYSQGEQRRALRRNQRKLPLRVYREHACHHQKATSGSGTTSPLALEERRGAKKTGMAREESCEMQFRGFGFERRALKGSTLDCTPARVWSARPTSSLSPHSLECTSGRPAACKY
jgi:hypothetical protein